jgi:hypothetical protein
MLRTTCVVVTGLLLSACAQQGAAKRADYWRSETDRSLPAGSSLAVAEAFFAQRGLRLVCCVDKLNGTKPKRYALDRDVAQSILMHYDVAILVDTTPDEHVSSVTVEQWGIGL